MSQRKKIMDIFENKVVVEIYEKERDRDGMRFYDTVILRRYYDENGEERRTEYLQLKDLDTAHIALVKAKEYIKTLLWKNRTSGSTNFEDYDEGPADSIDSPDEGGIEEV